MHPRKVGIKQDIFSDICTVSPEADSTNKGLALFGFQYCYPGMPEGATEISDHSVRLYTKELCLYYYSHLPKECYMLVHACPTSRGQLTTY